MPDYDVKKMLPRRRSALRRRAGMAWYTARRYLLWCSPQFTFARQRDQERDLPFVYASHSTPLLRKLKDVDMVYQVNKIQNLRLAVERLDGLLLRPGETMSFWQMRGFHPRTPGYFPLAGKVTKGALRRGTLSIVSPS